jgi:hypothetical protein
MTYFQLLTPHSSLRHYSLLSTQYSVLSTHYSLLTTHYSLLTTHYSLFATHDTLFYSLLAHLQRTHWHPKLTKWLIHVDWEASLLK